MNFQALMTYAGMASTVVAGLALVQAAWRLNTAKVWKEEAEAQRARAERLEEDLDEIKERLERIEKENQRLIEILTALDPDRLRALRI